VDDGCQRDTIDYQEFLSHGDSCQFTVQVDGSYDAGSYSNGASLDVWDITTQQDVSKDVALTVNISNQVAVTSTSLTPSAFYPLVRDGYRDYAHYSFSLNEAASGAVQVLNGKGKVVKTFGFSGRRSISVAWNGRNNAGSKVSVGYYRFRVVAHAHGTTVTSLTRTTQVKTGHTYKTKHLYKRGRNSYSHSGCNSRADGWDWWLDSQFGCHDSVTYRFAVPTAASNISGSTDHPYFQGPVSVSRTRSGGYVYEKAAALSGSYGDITYANLSYKIKVAV
jgi:hypothetical protein